MDPSVVARGVEKIGMDEVIVDGGMLTDRLKPSYVASSESILFTSTVHRSQTQNVEECLSKASGS